MTLIPQNYFNTKKFSCGYDDNLNSEKEELINKLTHTIIMMEFMFKVTGGMTKREYAKLRTAHRQLDNRLDILINSKSKSEYEGFEKFVRKFCLPPNAYRGGKL